MSGVLRIRVLRRPGRRKAILVDGWWEGLIVVLCGGGGLWCCWRYAVMRFSRDLSDVEVPDMECVDRDAVNGTKMLRYGVVGVLNRHRDMGSLYLRRVSSEVELDDVIGYPANWD
jgi:hypothetical protein